MKTKYDCDEMSEFIRKYIHSKRDRDILCDRLLDGLLFKELAVKYNLTERHIKRIVAKADKLFIELQNQHKRDMMQ